MEYRITITGAYPSPNNVTLEVLIEKRTLPDPWQPIPECPSKLQLPTIHLSAILRSSKDDSIKRAELLVLLRKTTKQLPVLIAQIALDKLYALLPTGWPVTIEV